MIKQITAVAVGTVIGYFAAQAITLVAIKPITKFTMARTMEALS